MQFGQQQPGHRAVDDIVGIFKNHVGHGYSSFFSFLDSSFGSSCVSLDFLAAFSAASFRPSGVLAFFSSSVRKCTLWRISLNCLSAFSCASPIISASTEKADPRPIHSCAI